MAVSVRIETAGGGWADIQQRLKAAEDGKAIRLAMNRRIRDLAKPVEAELKQAVLAVDVGVTQRSARDSARTAARRQLATGGKAKRGGSGLRATVSRAVQTKITNNGPRQGVRLRVDGTKLPDGQKKLPKYLDGQGRWRHPVFGKDVYVQQTGSQWWSPVIRSHVARLRGGVAGILEDIAKELE